MHPPAVSGAVPLIGHTREFLRDPLALLARGHAEHGAVFSVGLPGERAVVLLGSEHTRRFFAETDSALVFKGANDFIRRLFDRDFYLFASPREYHRQREVLLPHFRPAHLAGAADVMETEAERAFDALGDTGVVDLLDLFGPLVMRIAAHAFLGKEFSAALHDGFYREMRRLSAGMDPVLPGWLPLPHLLRGRVARNRLRRAFAAQIARRRREPADPPDFLQDLCGTSFSDGAPVPDGVLVNMILLLCWAGHETTCGQLAWTLADLLGSPDTVNAVRDGRISVDHAVLESERLHPVSFVIPRRTAAVFEVGEWTVRPGTLVLTSPAITHRMPDEFGSPDRYLPERFADPRLAGRLHGFGGGVHRCLGTHFARLEMRVVTSLMLRRFDLELLDVARPVAGSRTKWPRSPLRVGYRRVTR